jgi:hypothetical protein
MGVGTAMKITSPCSIPRRLSVVKSMSPFSRFVSRLVDRDFSRE